MKKLPHSFGDGHRESWRQFLGSAPRTADDAPDSPWVDLKPQSAVRRRETAAAANREGQRTAHAARQVGLHRPPGPIAHSGNSGAGRARAQAQRVQDETEQAEGQYGKVEVGEFCLAVEREAAGGNLPCWVVCIEECEQVETSDLEFAKLKVTSSGTSEN
jgi:hypothetical protein